MADRAFVAKNGLIVNTNLLWANAGQVGINNSAPDANLTVTGTANVSGNVRTGAINVVGNAAISGNLTLTGTINRNPRIDLTGAVTGNATLTDLANGSITTVFADNGLALGTKTTGDYVANLTMGVGLTNTSGATSGESSIPTIAVRANNGIIANSTGTFAFGNSGLVVNATGIHVLANSGLVANATGTHVLANSGLVANATGVHVLANSGITANSTGVFARANTGLVANATGIHVLGSNSVTSNSTGLFVAGNSGLVQNATGLHVLANNGIVSNATGVYVQAGTGIVVNSTGVHVTTTGLNQGANTGDSVTFANIVSSGDLTVGGDALVVNGAGDKVGVNTTSLDVAFQVVGEANISGDVRITGNLTVVGTQTSEGTTVATGDYIPDANGRNLGNTTSRWDLFGIDIDAANATLSTSVFVGANVSLNTTMIQVGNSTVNAKSNSSTWVSDAGLFRATMNVGANVLINTSTISVGNSTVNSMVNSVTINSGSLGLRTAVAIGANVTMGTVDLSIGNSTVNTLANSILVATGNVTVRNQLTAGANVVVDTVRVAVGNSTANLVANSIIVKVENASGSANIGPGGFVVGTQTINSTAVAVGANLIIDTVKATIGNSTVNVLANSILLKVENATSSANHDASGFRVGIVTLNTTAAAVGANVVATSSTVSVGNSTVNTVANSSQVTSNVANFDSGNFTTRTYTGNSTANVVANSTVLQVANSTGTTNVTPTSVVTGISVHNSTAFAVGANVVFSSADVKIGNSTVNAFANSLLIRVADATSSANHGPGSFVVGTQTINTTAIAAGANVLVDTVKATIGNSTVNALANSILLKVENASGSANHEASGFRVGTSLVNSTAAAATVFVAGANVTVDTVKLAAGNSTVNLIANSVLVKVEDATSSANHTAGGFTAGVTTQNTTAFAVGTSVVNSTVLAAGANVLVGTVDVKVGNSTVNAFANSLLVRVADVTSSANHGPGGFVAGITSQNTTVFAVGSNVVISATGFSIGNSTVNTTANSIALVVPAAGSIVLTNGASIQANGTTGVAEYVLTSNGASGVYWAESAGGGGTVDPDGVFYPSGQTVNTDFTTTATLNYLSAGPIVLNANVTITAGSRWAIV